MANMNPENFGVISGRLAKDPTVFDNKDGSKKVQFTVIANNTWSDANGKPTTEGIQVEAFVTKENVAAGKNPFATLETGDKVAVNYSLRQNNYTNKDGVKVYEQIAFVEGIKYLETKNEKAARQARKAANAAATATAPEATVTAPAAPAQA